MKLLVADENWEWASRKIEMLKNRDVLNNLNYF